MSMYPDHLPKPINQVSSVCLDRDSQAWHLVIPIDRRVINLYTDEGRDFAFLLRRTEAVKWFSTYNPAMQQRLQHTVKHKRVFIKLMEKIDNYIRQAKSRKIEMWEIERTLDDYIVLFTRSKEPREFVDHSPYYYSWLKTFFAFEFTFKTYAFKFLNTVGMRIRNACNKRQKDLHIEVAEILFEHNVIASHQRKIFAEYFGKYSHKQHKRMFGKLFTVLAFDITES